jgi:hypothetical protein
MANHSRRLSNGKFCIPPQLLQTPTHRLLLTPEQLQQVEEQLDRQLELAMRAEEETQVENGLRVHRAALEDKQTGLVDLFDELGIADQEAANLQECQGAGGAVLQSQGKAVDCLFDSTLLNQSRRKVEIDVDHSRLFLQRRPKTPFCPLQLVHHLHLNSQEIYFGDPIGHLIYDVI